MKKLTYRLRNWFAHRQFYVAKRRSKRKPALLVTLKQPTGPAWRAQACRHNLCMPKTLCFNENCGESLQALDEIRTKLQLRMRGARRGGLVSKHRNARIRQAGRYRSFENLELVTPAAALVLAADFERARKQTGIIPTVYNVEKWSDSVRDTLWEIGFFDIVGFPTDLDKPKLDDDFVILPMRSGDTADGPAISELIDNLRALYPKAKEDDETSERLLHLYGAMVEAVVNVCRHAYPQDGVYRFKPLRRWWMTGAVDRKERWTTAVIFDQGITIPVSLPQWSNYASWQQKIAAKLGLAPGPDDYASDGEAIAVAVEESVSSTGQDHRGHGLAQMRGFVNDCSEGYLRIMSRCGEVVFYPGDRKVIKTHKASVGGTLIEWNVLI